MAKLQNFRHTAIKALILHALKNGYMQVFKTKKALQNYLFTAHESQKIIGFVPTMGALHIGHISLVNKCLTESDIAVVSIFVNPTQFNNGSDLAAYPRTLEKDVELLKKTSNNIIVFAPSADDLYNGEVKSEPFEFGGLENQMEGQHRPGHFDGVGTVLTLLFDAVKPKKAFFGEKDFQQLQIVKKLVELKSMDLEIIGCDIYREAHGLAYSSRNERLTKEQRKEAKLLFDVLQGVKKDFGTKSVKIINTMVQQRFEQNPLFELEYFEIADVETLVSIKSIDTNKKYRAFLAVYAGEVRLIDNIALN